MRDSEVQIIEHRSEFLGFGFIDLSALVTAVTQARAVFASLPFVSR